MSLIHQSKFLFTGRKHVDGHIVHGPARGAEKEKWQQKPACKNKTVGVHHLHQPWGDPLTIKGEKVMQVRGPATVYSKNEYGIAHFFRSQKKG